MIPLDGECVDRSLPRLRMTDYHPLGSARPAAAREGGRAVAQPAP
jgi:hypothetical protein